MSDLLPDQGTRETYTSGDGQHFYLQADDHPDTIRRFERKLHVSRALNPDGVHIDVQIWGLDGNDHQSSAGMNLTPSEAADLIGHIAKVLAGLTVISAEQGGAS